VAKRIFVAMWSLLAVLTVALCLPRPAAADSVSVGVQTDSLQLGIQIGDPPPLVPVPGTPVYRAPDLPYNYFVYAKRYYLFHQGHWYRSRHHNGPWAVIAVNLVPAPLLAVPVDYYAAPPAHWKKHGPPPWARAKGPKRSGHDRNRDDDHGRRGRHRD